MHKTIKYLLAVGMALLGSASADAATYDNIYFFGDSQTECCAYGRFTNNGAPNWSDLLSPLIGARYSATLQNNLAVGGAQSGYLNVNLYDDRGFGLRTGFLSQVERFRSQGTVVSPRDIAAVWIGSNDIWPSARPADAAAWYNLPLGVRPAVDTLADYVAGNTRTGIQSLVDKGFRNILLLAPFDHAQSGLEPDAASQALAGQYSFAIRDRLAKLSVAGANTQYLDTLSLLQRVQANPGAFGFVHVTGGRESCRDYNCASLSLAQQNTFIFVDDAHFSNGFHRLLATFAAGVVDRFTTNADGTNEGGAEPTAVPEPASAALLLTALAGLGLGRVHRSKAV